MAKNGDKKNKRSSLSIIIDQKMSKKCKMFLFELVRQFSST